MKHLFILVFFVATAHFAGAASLKNTDTAELKAKTLYLEQVVNRLQAEMKILKANDSTHTAELNSLKQSLPAAKQKKLVIDRRGSKQAYFQ